MTAFAFYKDREHYIRVFRGSEPTRLNYRAHIAPLGYKEFRLEVWADSDELELGKWTHFGTFETAQDAAQVAVNALRLGMDTGKDDHHAGTDLMKRGEIGQQIENYDGL